MGSQPRIRRAGLGHALLQFGARPNRVLAESHAQSSLGHQQVRHAAGPVAGLDGADRQRVRDGIGRHERIGADVAASLQAREGVMDREVGVDRADPGVPGAAVGGAAGHLDPEGQGAGVRCHQRAAGGFGDDAGVTGVAAFEGAERAEPAVLLADDEVRGHLASQLHVRRANRGEGGQDRHHSGLHVARASAVHHVPGDSRAERVVLPLREVAGRDHVDVSLQDQRRPVAALGGADQAPRLGARGLAAGESLVAPEFGQVHRPQVDVEVQALQLPGQHVLQLRLRGTARHARHFQQLQQLSPDRRLVHRGQRRRLDLAHRHKP